MKAWVFAEAFGRFLLDRMRTQRPAFKCEGNAELEGNFEDYEADKIRRLGPDSVEPNWNEYKKLSR